MAHSTLEHVNITVKNCQQTANILCELFDWHIRWQGKAIYDGQVVHVGSDNSYLAIYSLDEPLQNIDDSHRTPGAMNHVGIVVEDLNEVERRVKKAGFVTKNHADYEPGRRFYFEDGDKIEFEVVSYS